MARLFGGLLALSVLVNAGLLVAYLGRDDAPTSPVASAAPPAEPAAVDAAERSATCAACEAELSDCRTSSWDAVAAAMERRAAEVLAEDEEAEEPGAARAMSATPELQQDVLDQIAREHLRRHWESAEDDLLGVVMRDLSDPGKQRQDLERDVGQLTGVLALGDDRAGEFGDAYAELRARRVATARAAVEKSPPDWRGVAAAAKGLFADEDALAERFGGEAGRERVRISQLEKRTALLGVLATLAGDPWDEAIAW